MKVLIHSNQLDIRGTGNAMYAYAKYARDIWGCDIHFAYDTSSCWTSPLGIEYVKNNFDWSQVIAYSHIDEVSDYAKNHNIDFAYMVKSGEWDGKLIKNCRVGVHAVFRSCEPHGDAYAYISEWLTEVMSGGALPYVSYPAHVVPATRNLRDEWNIPAGAFVFGRHGGEGQFDLQMVHETIWQLVHTNPNWYFVFMNTDQFCDDHPQIIHLPPTMDITRKCNFIASCDAMIHGREMGESFGMAICEFLAMGKPVVSYRSGGDQNHTRMINCPDLMYSDPQSLVNAMRYALDSRHETTLYKDKVRQYEIEHIMETQFKPIFLGT